MKAIGYIEERSLSIRVWNGVKLIYDTEDSFSVIEDF
jgi:hypothetical protein